MKINYASAFLIGAICSSLQSYAYIPGDVNRFKNAIDSIQCNLTGSAFSSYFEKVEK